MVLACFPKFTNVDFLTAGHVLLSKSCEQLPLANLSQMDDRGGCRSPLAMLIASSTVSAPEFKKRVGLEALAHIACSH